MGFLLQSFKLVDWVNEPKQWNKHGVNHEHDGLFFDNTIVSLVVVFKYKCLHNECHQSSGKEQS